MEITHGNCGLRNEYESYLRSSEHFLSNSENKAWKNSGLTRFELLTFAKLVQSYCDFHIIIYCHLLIISSVYYRIHGHFELAFKPVSARGFVLFTQHGISQLRKRLELHFKWCIFVIKIRWKLQLVGFLYDKKSANVVMWKDKEYEFISNAWLK